MVLFTQILHIMLSLILILIILLQPGKDSGAVFGGQAGNSAYSARTNANPLGRATTIIAVMFMVTSISLAWFSTVNTQDSEEMEAKRQNMSKRITKADLEFSVPKLPGVVPTQIMSTPPAQINPPILPNGMPNLPMDLMIPNNGTPEGLPTEQNDAPDLTPTPQ